jgi:hypothetical protein
VLRRSLAVYRMVFGQNRQEDLLAYLLANMPAAQIDELARELCINLEPPHPKHTARRIKRVKIMVVPEQENGSSLAQDVSALSARSGKLVR